VKRSLLTPLVLGGLLVLVGLIGTGCGWWPFSGNEVGQEDGQMQNSDPLYPSSTGTDLHSVVIGENTVPEQEMVAVETFFVDDQSGKLVSEKKSIPKVTGIARAALQELIRGPAIGSSLTSPIPLGASLLDINVRSDGRCIVDLSREFRANLDKKNNAEELAVYSVVNTLTQFPTIKEVQILIDGQVVETLAGKIDLTQPLVRNTALIK
jgi:germination protein M